MEALGIILSGQLVRVAAIVLLESSFVMPLVDFTWKESLNALGNGYEFGNGKEQKSRPEESYYTVVIVIVIPNSLPICLRTLHLPLPPPAAPLPSPPLPSPQFLIPNL
jgi:hypothetical protein